MYWLRGWDRVPRNREEWGDELRIWVEIAAKFFLLGVIVGVFFWGVR